MFIKSSMSGIFGGFNTVKSHKYGVFPITPKGTSKTPVITMHTEDEAIVAAEEMTILNDKPFVAKRL